MFQTFSKKKQEEKQEMQKKTLAQKETSDVDTAEQEAFSGVDSFMMSKRIDVPTTKTNVSNFQS
jgi:hypothetical protein